MYEAGRGCRRSFAGRLFLGLALASLSACSGLRLEPVRRALIEPPPIEAGLAPDPGRYAPGFDALHYDISITLPDTGSTIEGTTAASIRVESAGRDTLALDFTGLAVDEVRVGDDPARVRYEGGRIYVPVPTSVEAGDTLEVRISYHGVPDDGLILDENVHGAPTAFADNWPNRARFWFPSIDHPSDKATVSFEIRLSPDTDRTVIANGRRLQSSDPSVWRWEATRPIPTYTMVIGAADFAVERIGEPCAGGSCASVTTWLFPPDSARADRSFRRADDMLAYYSDLIAPFPYEKLAHVQSSTRFGGMENASAIFYDEESIAEGRDIESTVAHETAHQWFGDAVTESDWHHLWLSEGFATYFGALFFEHADGTERFREIMNASRRTYLDSDVRGVPIINPEQVHLFQLLNANNYQKGAWVLHMLRRLLGDEDFFAGIREYYRTFEHGVVTTEDFRVVMQEISGANLRDFFDQWVFSPGHPMFDVRWTSASDGVQIRIEQVQPPEWPTFRVPLTLAFETPGGSIRRTVQLDERIEEGYLDIRGSASAMKIDPDGDLLHQVMAVDKSAIEAE